MHSHALSTVVQHDGDMLSGPYADLVVQIAGHAAAALVKLCVCECFALCAKRS